MGLPTSRDVTFAPGAQVPSSVLNNIQDAIVDAHTALRTQTIHIEVAGFLNIENFTYTANFEPTAIVLSAAALVSLALPVGWTITSIAARGQDTGAGTAPSVELQKRVGNAALATVATINTFSGASSVQTVGGLSETVVADTSYSFVLQTPAAGWTPGVFTVSQLSLTMTR